MTQHQKPQTLDWLKFLLTTLAIIAAVITGFVRLEMNQGSMSNELREIKQNGTSVAVSNRERISVLEARLTGIESSQKTTIDKLDRLNERIDAVLRRP